MRRRRSKRNETNETSNDHKKSLSRRGTRRDARAAQLYVMVNTAAEEELTIMTPGLHRQL